MSIFKKILLFKLLVLLLFCGKAVQAEGSDKNLTLLVVPYLSFQEVEWLNENGQYSYLWKTSRFAGMNVRPDGPYSYLNNTVSLSIGTRGLGIEGWNAYSHGEMVEGVPIEQLYQQWTGIVVDEGELIHPYFHNLVDKNNKAEVGILGQTLKEHGVSRFVIGHSDVHNEKVRYGSLFTIDGSGLTDGFLLDMTKANVASPSGLVMDSEKIIKMLSTINETNESTFTVIEWGDIYRLFEQKKNMTLQYFTKQYEDNLLRLEMFINELVTAEMVDHLMLISPMVHSDAYQSKQRLSPYFYWETPLADDRMVQSKTTRQDFVISNLDIVPTILHFYNIPVPNSLIGKPLQTEVINSSVYDQGLKNLNLMFQIFKTRNVVLSSYITLLVLLLIIVSMIILLKDKKDEWKRVAKTLLLGGISSPIWFLVTPYFLHIIKPNIYLLLIIALSFLTGVLLVKYGKNPILTLSFILFLTLTVDILNGSFFMQRSYLGYDPIIGARYYGIGNEYAGIYLISSLLLLQHSFFKKWYVLSVLALSVLFVLASSNLGANAGATISAGLMFAFFYYRYYFSKFHWHQLLTVIAIVVPLVLLVLFLTQLQGKESHIGYAYSKLLSGDFTYIFDTIKRKLEMNWKIFRYSNWTQLFVTTYLLIAIYLWRGKNIVKNEMKKIIIQTGVFASVALLLLNDSGVVAAATSMFIIVCTSYYWALQEGK